MWHPYGHDLEVPRLVLGEPLGVFGPHRLEFSVLRLVALSGPWLSS